MYGYANPVSFKAIDDTDIDAVEKSVREQTLKYLENKLSESINVSDCDVLVDDDQLEEYFGPFYKFAPSKFTFLPGEKKLIKQLVLHAQKIIDGNGINSGLKQFKPKRALKRKCSNNSPIELDTQITNATKKIDENEFESLLPRLNSSLFAKVNEILMQYKADEIINTENISPNIVSVVYKNGQVYGDINCILCQNESKANKQNPKRISYKINNSSQFWVTSNFTTHLKKRHGLSANKKKPKERKPQPKSVIDTIKANDNGKNITLAPDETIEFLDIEVISHSKLKIKTLYEQISSQITSMSEAVLQNDEQEDEMTIFLPAGDETTIKVVNAPGDGNCLFKSLAHQLHRHKMDSTESRTATAQLRARVVAYIQQNVEPFTHELKGRIYDIKEKQRMDGNHSDSESFDMEREIQFFLYQLLPRNGYWGGSETLKAVSILYKVNVILFYEDDSFSIVAEEDAEHAKTIAVAYRFGESNSRNHYDSVTDISSSDIYALTDNSN